MIKPSLFSYYVYIFYKLSMKVKLFKIFSMFIIWYQTGRIFLYTLSNLLTKIIMKIKVDQVRTYDNAGYRRRAACLCFRSDCESEVSYL